MDSNKSKCWAIKGSKPIKFTSGSKAKINIGGFYTENGEFYWYDLGIKQNTDSYLKSLLDFKRDIGTKIFLLMDRATWHRSNKAKEFYQDNKQWLKISLFPTATPDTVLHQLDQKIIYPHYDFKHLTEKYFEIGMKLNDFSIQLVKYCR